MNEPPLSEGLLAAHTHAHTHTRARTHAHTHTHTLAHGARLSTAYIRALGQYGKCSPGPGAPPPAGRQAQPPELPKWGVGGAAPFPGAPLLPQPLRTGVAHPPLVPGTGHFPTVLLPAKLQRDAAGSPGQQHPPPGQPRTPPALGQPAPLGMLRGRQPSPAHPAASPGTQGCPGMGRSNNIPEIRLGQPQQSQRAN